MLPSSSAFYLNLLQIGEKQTGWGCAEKEAEAKLSSSLVLLIGKTVTQQAQEVLRNQNIWSKTIYISYAKHITQ